MQLREISESNLFSSIGSNDFLLLISVGKKDWLQKGDEVKVIGPSVNKAGHLIVQWQNQTHDVPHQALQLKVKSTIVLFNKNIAWKHPASGGGVG